MKKTYSLFAVILFFVGAVTSSKAQITTVFTDNFDRASFVTGGSYGTPATVYTFTTGGTSTITTTLVGGSNYMANINSGSANQRSLFFAPMNVYSSPFNPVLDANPGVITWTFNMRTNTAVITTTPVTGSAAGGIDLCSDAAGNIYNGSPTGYGVVFNSSATGGVALVKFSGGLNANTVLITQTTTMPKTDFYSVRVTYDPATNSWSLFVRDDGASVFSDPSTGVTVQQGATIIDGTYTNQSMVNFGAVYTWAAGAGKTMSVDNYTVSVNVVPCIGSPSSAVLNASATTGCGFYTSNLFFTSLTGSGLTYQWQSSPDNSAWTSVSGATNSTYTAGVTTNIFYRCQITCSNSSTTYTTPGQALTITTPPSIAILPFSESFESAWISSCGIADQPNSFWVNAFATGNRSFRREDDAPGANTGSWGSPTSGSYSPASSAGSHSARFHSFQAAAGNSGALSLFINLGVAGTKQITYDYINPSGTDELVCQVSTDGGSTFTTLDIPPVVATSWTTRTVTTTATSPTAIIRFVAISDQGNDDIGLDNVNVTQLCATPVITGLSSVCLGWHDTLTAAPTGGTWNSTTPGVAAIDPVTGVVTPASPGTTVISNNNGTGCIGSITLTINPAVTAITGTTQVCPGSTTSLSDAGGGTWSSSNTSIATVGSTGVVSGIVSGPDSITYTQSPGCIARTAVTVNGLPGVTGLSNSQSLCFNASATGTASFSYTGVTNGADQYTLTWAPGGVLPDVASFTALPGGAITVTAPAGASPNTYTGTLTTGNSVTGCTSTSTVTIVVNSLPALSGLPASQNACFSAASAQAASFAYTGITNGANQYTLTWSPAGPTDVSSYTAIPGSPSGTLNVNIPAGTGVSNYTGTLSVENSSTGCIGVSTVTLAVNDLPTLTGLGTAENCFNTALFSASIPYTGTTNGTDQYMLTWSPAGPTDLLTLTALPVGSFPVNVPGGTAPANYTGTFTLKNSVTGCINTATTHLIIDALPTITATATPNPICAGQTLSLNATPAGGSATYSGYSWSGPSFTAATLATTLTNINAGEAAIYSVTVTDSHGCTSLPGTTLLVTVNALPVSTATVTPTPICPGSTLSLSSAATGGSGTYTGFAWNGPSGFASSAQDTTLANIAAGGAGVYSVTATDDNGCTSLAGTASVVVSLPPTLTGLAANQAVCFDTLHTDTASFTYTGVSGGADMYSLTWLPGSILTDITALTTLPSGAITVSVPMGTDTGTYTGTLTLNNSATGCTDTTTLTVVVNPLPALTGLTPNEAFCFNTSLTQTALFAYTGITNGADQYTLTWAPAGPGIVLPFTVLPGSPINVAVPGGTPSGNYAGNLTVKNSGTGCTSVATIITSVNPLPTVTTTATPNPVCEGNTLTLNSTPAGGSGTYSVYAWSGPSGYAATTQNATVSNITTTGVGVYSVNVTDDRGCTSLNPGTTAAVIVNSGPAPITGTTNVCAGGTTALSDTSSGGTWSSNNTSLASIDPGTGIVTGVIAAGAATITYTAPNGCISTTDVTVNPLPFPIPGTTICTGTITTLTDLPEGGTWSSNFPAVANVTDGGPGIGIVDGVSAGTPVITYTLPTGCYTTTGIVVNPVAPVSGITNVCFGAVITLTDFSFSGGTWSSSDITIATVDPASGIVSSVAAGTAIITYTLPTGCITNTPVIFQSLPTPITGPGAVCTGATITLSNDSTGGTWSSSDGTAATVSTSGTGDGIVTGLTAGTPTITYTLGTGCAAIALINVNAPPAMPDPIGGTTTLCESTAAFLTDGTADGTWSSSNTTVASADASGLIIAISGGATTISYTVTNGCGNTSATSTITVNPLPAVPDPISGSTNICNSRSAVFGDAMPGGLWASSDVSIATISTTGVVTGLSTGTTIISYINVNSCGSEYALSSLTVNPLPDAGTVSGAAAFCAGTDVILSDGAFGGVWSSENAAVATVAAGGDVTGVASGVANISYTVTNGCGTIAATAMVTINSSPATPARITGPGNGCPGSHALLSDVTTGGVWSSSNTAVATVSTLGNVTAVASGTAAISYTATNGCGSAAVGVTFTVDPSPAVAGITGTPKVCAGSVTLLNDLSPGGLWLSDNNSVAVVGPLGIVTGIAPGTATISYVATNSCGSSSTATVTVTVNAAPTAGTITGTNSVCPGDTISLSNVIHGGTWSTSDSIIATVSASGLVTGFNTGAVTITYAFTNSCGTLDATLPFIVRSINDCDERANMLSNTANEFKAYPNPNNGSFTLQLSSNTDEQMQVVITNAVGQKVSELTATTNRPVEVKLTGAAGVYFIAAITGQGKCVAKVTVE